MNKLNRRTLLGTSLAGAGVAVLSGSARAQTASAYVPPAYTPDDLKSTLTPLGGVRAGNADGTIPAWNGGYSTLPEGYKIGDPRPIPFADEKPLFSITATNVAQYEDRLCDGQLAFFQKFPDFRMDIYPTHRTAIAPQYVYDYTYKNASVAQLAPDGNSISNAYGGIPFPLAVNGHQVIWNHLLAWRGSTIHNPAGQLLMTADGDLVVETVIDSYYQSPYYFEGGEASFNGYYSEYYVNPTAPPYQAGGAIVDLQPVNPLNTPQRSWIYLPGERRVRTAPDLNYDTPNSLTGGITNWDEYQIFFGAVDEYDFTLLGKKEMYVPYNMNKAWAAPASEQYKPRFFNPDYARWELHRVWVVEMTVKAGKRNVDARRKLYFDEDTWNALMSDVYDAGGAYWKFQHDIPAVCADIPCMVGAVATILYDFHSGAYNISNQENSSIRTPYCPIPQLPASYFTPGQLVARAGGF